MDQKQTPRGKLGIVKVNLWVPSAMHEKVKELVEQEVRAGRETSISKVYQDALRAYLGAWLK